MSGAGSALSRDPRRGPTRFPPSGARSAPAAPSPEADPPCPVQRGEAVRGGAQGKLAVELRHGGGGVGHPLHPAVSDLPIGLWAGVMVLDATDRDPAPRRGIDAAGMLSAAGILAAGATALTGLSDWTVSNDQDRRVGLFHALPNPAAPALHGASLATRMAGHRP